MGTHDKSVVLARIDLLHKLKLNILNTIHSTQHSAENMKNPHIVPHYTQISPLRNLTPKKWDMNGHLISSMLPDHNTIKKRGMNANAIHPLS